MDLDEPLALRQFFSLNGAKLYELTLGDHVRNTWELISFCPHLRNLQSVGIVKAVNKDIFLPWLELLWLTGDSIILLPYIKATMLTVLCIEDRLTSYGPFFRVYFKMFLRRQTRLEELILDLDHTAAQLFRGTTLRNLPSTLKSVHIVSTESIHPEFLTQPHQEQKLKLVLQVVNDNTRTLMCSGVQYLEVQLLSGYERNHEKYNSSVRELTIKDFDDIYFVAMFAERFINLEVLSVWQVFGFATLLSIFLPAYCI